jgi:hypothetical protein
VTLGAEAGEAVAGKDGRWQVTLRPQPVSKVALTLTAAGKNTVAVKDVLLGDVWPCSGSPAAPRAAGVGPCDRTRVSDNHPRHGGDPDRGRRVHPSADTFHPNSASNRATF